MKWLRLSTYVELLMGRVIKKKLLGKFAKHASGALVGLLLSDKAAPYVKPVTDALEVSDAQLETGLFVIFTGLFGTAFNYINHRFFSK